MEAVERERLEERVEELIYKASEHGVIAGNVLGEVFIAWCDEKGRGCFAAELNRRVSLWLTGDGEQAVKEFEEKLRALEELRKRATSGGWVRVTEYVKKKRKLAGDVKHFVTMLAEVFGIAVDNWEDEQCLRRVISRYCPCRGE